MDKLIKFLKDKPDNGIKDKYNNLGVSVEKEKKEKKCKEDNVLIAIYQKEINSISELIDYINSLLIYNDLSILQRIILESILADIIKKQNDNDLCNILYKKIEKIFKNILNIEIKFNKDLYSALKSDIMYNNIEKYSRSCNRYKSDNFLLYSLCKNYVKKNDLPLENEDKSKTFLDYIKFNENIDEIK